MLVMFLAALTVMLGEPSVAGGVVLAEGFGWGGPGTIVDGLR